MGSNNKFLQKQLELILQTEHNAGDLLHNMYLEVDSLMEYQQGKHLQLLE